MKKPLALLIIAALCSLASPTSPIAKAQEDVPRFEIGAQVTTLRLSELETTDAGIGGRFTYNINRNFAVEAEGNFFPKDREFEGGRKVQGLFGVKAGVRGERVGVFAKARPGFVRFSEFVRDPRRCIVLDPSRCPSTPPVDPFFSETNFALDLGGVVEFYPSRQSVIRFDLGNTIIRPASDESILRQTNNNSFAQEFIRSTSNNLQFTVGAGFRF